MKMYRTGAAVVMGVGVMVAGAAAANAHYRGHYYPGCNCGPVAPTTHVRTIHTSKAETHYHDVSVVKHVHRVHRVTNITRIQPIFHIHEVTRIHHHTVVETRDAYRNLTEHLRPIRVVTHSVQNFYDCHCGR